MSKSKKVKAAKIQVHSFSLCGRLAGSAFLSEPVFVLPADAVSYDRMVEQAAKALCNWAWDVEWTDSPRITTHQRKQAAIALAAIGIARPKEDKA